MKEFMTLTTPEALSSQKIYTVSEITREIRTLLEGEFKIVWIEGEVSNFKHHSSGHMYFTLKDETAQISAVFFSRANQFLKFDLKDGLRVITIGRISVYDQRGQYQIYVERVEPRGLGALQLAFLQLKEKLEKEGLFSPDRKRPIPHYSKRIGIVTSPTGAAIQDMLKIFKRRTYGLHILLQPVKVQGEGAADEIAEAIDRLSQLDPALDLVIIGRGGGSLEDLWAFNEEAVARAISRSKIPVISAVGHEVDWTISDFVSDLRAHTPTAAAEIVVTHWDELEEKLREAYERMRMGIRTLLETKQEALRGACESYAFRQPLHYVQQLAQRVDDLGRQMQNYCRSLLQGKRHVFENWVGKLGTLNPLSVLERGFSITFDPSGCPLREAKQVQVGDRITTKLKAGSIFSKVTEIGA